MMRQTTKYNFNKKVALVTGASRGIGKQICKDLLKSNCRVLGCYSSNEKEARNCRDELSKFGSNFVLKRRDVSKEDDIKKIYVEANNLWGKRFNFLINNAGILNQGNFDNLTSKNWDKTLKVNLRGPFLLSQNFMKKGNNNDSIVNIASIGGQIGGNKAPDYAASKAALISLTKSLARLGANKGIRSNAVSPGWIETDIFTSTQLAKLKKEAKKIIPMKRMGFSSEVSRAVLFLLSEESSYITGHCLNINGGLYLG